MTYVVALTGGIASGKTTVSDMFSELGVPVIDTDVIARELTEPGTIQLLKIIKAFGPSVVDANGRLNRKRMREIIFSDDAKRRTLESILHPAIFSEVEKRLVSIDAFYCLVVIPLLTEVGVPDWVDRVLVIDSDRNTQLKRLFSRDGISLKQAIKTLAAQTTRGERLSIANDVVENNGTRDDLFEVVSSLHKKYLGLSGLKIQSDRIGE
ncbi:dephospho-CoA kinase [Marinihelvus fidelis]|uniref:Dephospho-CoA kinase n=1 Tax=Marinihelvus fidelis TaxID=2613842 RepID=A0A5N0T3V6_9GAMM|nr:dephospho-CoA kinase [Marinihelvus fidelis]KAA9129750.1 dephospho-CoA kinase [Marinihelvus fidelis]